MEPLRTWMTRAGDRRYEVVASDETERFLQKETGSTGQRLAFEMPGKRGEIDGIDAVLTGPGFVGGTVGKQEEVALDQNT